MGHGAWGMGHGAEEKNYIDQLLAEMNSGIFFPPLLKSSPAPYTLHPTPFSVCSSYTELFSVSYSTKVNTYKTRLLYYQELNN
jgi:hypothetical protein